MTEYAHEAKAQTCSHCGQGPLMCRVQDKGSSDYYLSFTHTCARCGVVDSAESVIWSASPDEAGLVCPMCCFDYAPHFIGGGA
jgi:hypothetical protein